MARFHTIFPTPDCTDIDSRTFISCFPVLQCEAVEPMGLLTECDNRWNDNLCQTDKCYSSPVPIGETFMLQTRFADFVNADPLMPTLGWGDWMHIEMYNAEDGSLVATDPNLFASRYGVGALPNGAGSYQVIEIDNTLAAFSGVDCYYFEIYSEDAGGTENRRVCTNHFFSPRPCRNILRLESLYPEYDCFGNFYGIAEEWVGSTTDPFVYRNHFWIDGTVLSWNDSVVKTVVNNRATEVTVTEQYKVVMEGIIPWYIKNMISRVWAPGFEVYADNDLYELDSFQVDNKLRATAGRQFLFDWTMQKTCEINYGCVPLAERETLFVVPDLQPLPDCVECIPVTCIGP